MLEHRLAIVIAIAAFFLLIVGGNVNPNEASLACPEPTLVCNGQLFPALTGKVLYEHGHRLFAMSVGLLQIALTIVLWRRRRDLRTLAVASLITICCVGTLGAITVKYKLPWIVSTAHLVLAMSYLATLVYVARRTAFRDRPRTYRVDATTRRWIAIAAGAVMLQIVLGGLVRHHEATLASLSLPLHNGSLWPSGGPLPLKLHMLHRIIGVLVGLTVITASVVIYRRTRHRALRRFMVLAPALVVTQILLGAYVILTFRSPPVAVAHFAGATLLWVLWWTQWVWTEGSAQVEVSVGAEDGTEGAGDGPLRKAVSG